MKLDKTKTVIVIPAYNEEKTIGNLIKSIKGKYNIIVIDDGSCDKTEHILKEERVLYLKNSKNLGYDKSISAGIFFAKNKGFKYAITIDADGQHKIKDIEIFEKKLIEGYDLVVGIRDKKQRFGELFFAKISSLYWKIEDPLCGMKGYNLKVINSTYNYFFDSIGTKIALSLAVNNKKISQIRISTNQRIDQSRFGSGMVFSLKIIYGLALSLMFIRNRKKGK